TSVVSSSFSSPRSGVHPYLHSFPTRRSSDLRLVPGLLLGLEEHAVGVERRVVREEYAPLALVKELLQIRAEKDLRVGPQQYECVGSLEGGQQDRRDIERFLEGTTGEHAVLLNEMLCERRVGDSSGLIVLERGDRPEGVVEDR